MSMSKRAEMAIIEAGGYPIHGVPYETLIDRIDAVMRPI
jgi:hypothetical protein